MRCNWRGKKNKILNEVFKQTFNFKQIVLDRINYPNTSKIHFESRTSSTGRREWPLYGRGFDFKIAEYGMDRRWVGHGTVDRKLKLTVSKCSTRDNLERRELSNTLKWTPNSSLEVYLNYSLCISYDKHFRNVLIPKLNFKHKHRKRETNKFSLMTDQGIYRGQGSAKHHTSDINE